MISIEGIGCRINFGFYFNFITLFLWFFCVKIVQIAHRVERSPEKAEVMGSRPILDNASVAQ